MVSYLLKGLSEVTVTLVIYFGSKSPKLVEAIFLKTFKSIILLGQYQSFVGHFLALFFFFFFGLTKHFMGVY